MTVTEEFTVNVPSNGDTDEDEQRNGDDRSENELLPCNGIDDFEQQCQGVDQSVDDFEQHCQGVDQSVHSAPSSSPGLEVVTTSKVAKFADRKVIMLQWGQSSRD